MPGCTGAVFIKCLLDKNLKDVFAYNEEEGREKKITEGGEK